MINNRLIYDIDHKPMEIDEMLARGGEAEIYPLLKRPDVLFKSYHPLIIQKRGKDLQKKIDLMRKIPSLREDKNLSWPLINVYDDKKNWLGYCMYRGVGVTMFKLAHAILYQKHFPNLDRRKIVSYLIKYLNEIKKLHKKNIFIGDYNLHNILLDPNSDKVILIDCDSYQIKLQNQFFPCEVGSADMTPKEHQNRPFNSIVRTIESELFSVAIVLFKALMLGRHPYDIVGGTDPVQNLCQGKFPYGIGNKGIPKGNWYNIWSHIPHKIKTLFIQTFTVGANDPKKRVSLETWIKELKIYQREMEKGWHRVEVIPKEPKESKYRGNNSHS